MDTQKTLDWLNAACDKALTEARNGNTLLANKLAENAAVKHYFDNVHNLKSMTPEAWTQHYNTLFQEADRLREDYEQNERMVESYSKVDKISAELKALKGLVTQYLEAQTAPPKPDPKKKTKDETSDGETPVSEE